MRHFIVAILVAASTAKSAAYVTSGLPPRKHQAWLKKMTVDICQSPVGDLSAEMCDTAPQIMSAWAQNPYVEWSPSSSREDLPVAEHRGRECALAVEKLMKRLIDERRAGNSDAVATTETYNAVIEGWVRSGEGGSAAQRAEQILIEMQDLFAAGDKDVQPDLRSFRAVLLAWQRACGGRAGDKLHAAERAQRLLEWMIRLSEAGENTLARPDAECFDIVMHAWALSGHEDAPRMTEQLLVWMERLYREGNDAVKPQTRSFNQILIAYSKSRQKGKAQRAQDILEHMDHLAEQGNEDVRPSFISYSAVSYAWATSGEKCAARKAESTLKKTERAYRDGDLSLQPDTIMFNVVIDAWAKTESFAKTNGRLPYESARYVLDRQMQLYEDGSKRCRPDVYSYTSVINACERMSGGSRKQRERAFNVAESTFLELCESECVSPNHVTYGTMLKACAHLLPHGCERRQRFVKELFSKCCQDGCVGSMVLNRLREAATPALYKQLMGDAKKNDLPPEWTFQVPEDDKRLRKRQRNKRKKKTNRQKPKLMP